MLGYEGNSKVVLQNSGSGGINELADNFKEDEAYTIFNFLRLPLQVNTVI